MIVVTDTSVVLNLCLIGQADLLPRLFGQIATPAAVVSEFQRLAVTDSRFRGLVFPTFIRQADPARLLPVLASSRRLQEGEIAALSLAVEWKADAVLMDELAGRAAAASLGLRVVGLLGILLDARQRSLIPALSPLIDRLKRDAGFWIASSLRTSVLRDAGEAP